MRNPYRRLIGPVVLWVAAGVVSAQTAPPPEGDLVREVRALRESVEKAVALLDQTLTHSGVELLLKRIEIKERRVVPLEAELRGARDRLAAREGELEQIRAMLVTAEEGIAEGIRSGTDDEASEPRVMKHQMEQAIVQIDGELLRDEARVRRLEDEIAERLEQIETLEDTLEEKLEKLP